MVELKLRNRIPEAGEPNQGEDETGEPEFVETPTTRKITDAFDFARRTPTIAVVYGGAGVSKTITARRYVKSDRYSCYYVAASRWIRSPTALLQELAEAVGAYGRAYRNDSIAKAILERTKPGDLFIIDEAQHLDVDSLDGIRHFHDQGGIGLCYLGNEMVYRRISGAGRSAAFAQLHSRIGLRLHVASPSQGDVDAILDGWGVKGRQEREYAQQIASRPGGIRKLTQILRNTCIIARGMKRPLDQRLMREAAAKLGEPE
jgi:DNA transposition AAA+ family ATPase